jgi:hypothetical protein
MSFCCISYAVYRYSVFPYAVYHYAECHSAECHYAECRGTNLNRHGLKMKKKVLSENFYFGRFQKKKTFSRGDMVGGIEPGNPY